MSNSNLFDISHFLYSLHFSSKGTFYGRMSVCLVLSFPFCSDHRRMTLNDIIVIWRRCGFPGEMSHSFLFLFFYSRRIAKTISEC